MLEYATHRGNSSLQDRIRRPNALLPVLSGSYTHCDGCVELPSFWLRGLGFKNDWEEIGAEASLRRRLAALNSSSLKGPKGPKVPTSLHPKLQVLKRLWSSRDSSFRGVGASPSPPPGASGRTARQACSNSRPKLRRDPGR